MNFKFNKKNVSVIGTVLVIIIAFGIGFSMQGISDNSDIIIDMPNISEAKATAIAEPDVIPELSEMKEEAETIHAVDINSSSTSD